EYLKRETGGASREAPAPTDRRAPSPVPASSLPPVDRTYKLFIGGRQVRPDAPYARRITAPDGTPLGEVALGNRKDIRNAVEAAHAAAAWARADEFAARLAALAGGHEAAARREVEASIARLFSYAAWADKYDGAVHDVPLQGRDAGDARADRRGGGRLPRGAAAPRVRVARGAGRGRREHGGRGPLGEGAARRRRALHGARSLGRAGRGDQHRDRRERRAGARARRARRRGRRVVLRHARRGRGGGAGVGGQSQAHLGRVGGARLVRRAGGRGARVPPRGDAGEEHLDPL